MRKITYANALREALTEEMDRDSSVTLLGEDIGVYGGVFTVTRNLQSRFGTDRVVDTPLSEASIIGASVGMAMCGLRPVAEIMYSDFVTISSDQLVNNAAKMRYMFDGKVGVPMVLRTQCGSGRGSAAQHSQSLEAWYAHIPGLVVIMPSTPEDAKGLLKSAIRSNDPVLFIEHKMLYFSKGNCENEEPIPIGKADVKKAGSDITLVATSWMLPRALKVAEELENDGISIEVIDPRTLRPFDFDTVIESVRKTRRALIVHEAVEFAGIGAEISAKLHEELFSDLEQPVRRLCGEDTPIPYSAALEPLVVPSEDRIRDAAVAMMAGRKGS